MNVKADFVGDNASGLAAAGAAEPLRRGRGPGDRHPGHQRRTAYLDSDVKIPDAQQENVEATSNRTLTARDFGVVIAGEVAAGVGVAIASAAGGPSASIRSGGQIGQTGTVGGVNVEANSADTVTTVGLGVEGGILGGAVGVDSTHQSTPVVAASVDNSSTADPTLITTTSEVQVDATNDPSADAETQGYSINGGVSIGVSISNADVGGTTSSYLGNNVTVSASSLSIDAT